ncbi:MAG: hypothetical protein E6899_06185 [Neisseria sp.]|nr:hypothetical protein [Neisseria sp.]
MPFFIVFLDPLHTDFQSSGKPLNEYIARHPLMHDKLHRPAFAAKVLEWRQTAAICVFLSVKRMR